jgi:NADPH:quinone reductase-like Zn-dependent oxidoreductase
MKAIVIYSYGQKDVLKYDETIEKPVPKKNQVLVRVMAASVNPLDCKIRSGHSSFLSSKKFPKILGIDFAGWIEAVGENVKNFQKRDKVLGILPDMSSTAGTYAEYITIEEKNIVIKPDNLTYAEATCLPLAGLTALQGFANCNLSAGQKVLINGASGGVGTFAVQLAKIMGAVVTGVCSTKNIDLVKSLGADRVIDYQNNDFIKEKYQYDIIFDVVGNQRFDTCKHLLTPNGIYFTTANDAATQKDFLLTSLRSQKVKIASVKPNPLDLNYLAGLANDRTLRIIIDEQYDLKETPSAHAYSESGHVTGKLVINIK